MTFFRSQTCVMLKDLQRRETVFQISYDISRAISSLCRLTQIKSYPIHRTGHLTNKRNVRYTILHRSVTDNRLKWTVWLRWYSAPYARRLDRLCVSHAAAVKFLDKNFKLCFGSVSSPLCVCVCVCVWCVCVCVCVCENWKRICSQTQLSIKMFNDYNRQLHVSAFTGYLQVVFKRT